MRLTKQVVSLVGTGVVSLRLVVSLVRVLRFETRALCSLVRRCARTKDLIRQWPPNVA